MRKDSQKSEVYVADALFWWGTVPADHWTRQDVSLEEWGDLTRQTVRDGLAFPYPDQIRRRSAGEMPVTVSEDNGCAYTVFRHERFEVSKESLKPWIALHEAAHLLVPNHGEPHYWRWVSVYSGVIGRTLGQNWGERYLDRCRAVHVQYQDPRVARAG